MLREAHRSQFSPALEAAGSGAGERPSSPPWAIRVDSGVPVEVRLAGIFGQAPRHSQAVVVLAKCGAREKKINPAGSSRTWLPA